MTETQTSPRASAAQPARAGGTQRPPGMSGGRAGYYLYLIPGAILFLVVIVVPFFMNVGTSFTKWPGIGPATFVGLDNYTKLFTDATFWESFRNNLAMIVAMVAVPTLLGLVLAAALFDIVATRFGNRLASVLRAAYYLPQILPVAVAGVVWGWILRPTDGAANELLRLVGLDGLTQNWLGDPSTALLSVMVIMVWFQLGYPVVIFMSGLQRIDPELYEAADLDGATWFQRFRFITVRLLRPEIYVVVLTSTIAALKVFGPIFVLTRGGPGGSTLVPSYFSYQNFFEKANVGYGATIATVMTVIIVILTAFFLRMQSADERAQGR